MDETSISRDQEDLLHPIIGFLGFVWVLFQVYTGGFGVLEGLNQRIVHLGFALLFALLAKETEPPKRGSVSTLPRWILVVFCIISTVYGLVKGNEAVGARAGVVTVADIIFGMIVIALLLDGVRRTIGWPLSLISLISIAYARWGNFIPGSLGHQGYSWSRIFSHLYFGYEGIYGTAIGASATYIALFIVFGSFLQHFGGGDVLSGLAQSLLGYVRGGPAKVAVVASCLFGTISGSAAANVAATGSFTIPLMKKTGFSPTFAGAVETAASTGGQIMPPVMGVAAFLIAEYLRVPYVEVLKSAIFPALLYYLAIFWSVDLYSVRKGLKGVPKSELPGVASVLRTGWPMLIPVFLLLYFLIIVRSSVNKAAFWSVVGVLVVSALKGFKNVAPRRLISASIDAAKGLTTVALSCAAAGVVIGVMSLTGLGAKISMALISLAGGNLLVLLILTMIVALILGMGLPTVATYILLASLLVPAITEAGVTPIAAHLFVFYFGIMCNLTPPVAIAAYTAAGIAGSDPFQTALEALRLALPGFILPFVFTNNSAMLLVGSSAQEAVMSIITATIGILLLGASLFGQFGSRRISAWKRVLLLLAALLLLHTGFVTDVFGLVALALVILSEVFGNIKRSVGV